MNISILNNESQEITVACLDANLMNSYNMLSMNFENDDLARSSEELLKKMNIKTKHNDSEIIVLNISDYNLKIK